MKKRNLFLALAALLAFAVSGYAETPKVVKPQNAVFVASSNFP